MEAYEKENFAVSILGMHCKIISGSKSGYVQRNPRHLAIFNANVCTKTEKIWYGDLDITLDKNELSKLAQALNEDLYVLYEMDGRFKNEESPLIDKHVVRFNPIGDMTIGHLYEFILTDNSYDL